MTSPICQLVLDIEGTTCPVRFVSETLFPYAAARMGTFLEERQADRVVQDLLQQVWQAWLVDPDPTAGSLLERAGPNAITPNAILPYLLLLIRQDRKLTPLKDLQGLIWEEGYGNGEIQGPLYPDVAPALRRWQNAGVGLSVYSSGSIKAQQLIYGYSSAGDLRPLFQHWFDTKIGSKLEPQSYLRISEYLKTEPQAMLFISDSLDELKAARTCGVSVLFCDRGDLQPQGNDYDLDGLTRIESFNGLDF
jgi:enolase-phosphatase E1